MSCETGGSERGRSSLRDRGDGRSESGPGCVGFRGDAK